jgi:Spy/CpxP family protein refolding chaperone
MKKLTAILLLAAALVSNVSAHHMAQSDTAGIYIDEDSPHLLMTFY